MSGIEVFLIVLVALVSTYGVVGGVYMLGKAHGREEMMNLLMPSEKSDSAKEQG